MKQNRANHPAWVLASLALSMLLSSLGTSIANVGLPTLALAFGATFQQVQWVVIAYLLAVTALVVGAGRLGDLVGRRRLLLAGIFLFTLASALCSAAPTLPLLIAARALQGIGAAAMMALTMAFVAAAVPKDRTGSAMGMLGTMSAVGTALGPALGGVLIAGLGWPAIFAVNIPLGVLALALARRFLPADAPRPVERPRFDHAGTLLLALALAAYALAMTVGRGRFGLLNLALLASAALGMALFLRAEARAASPLVPLAMFRNRPLAAGFAASMLVTTVMMATLVIGPFYLAGVLKLDPARIGLVMSCGPIVSALSGIPAGRLVDRYGAHGMAIGGLALMAAGTGTLALLASPGIAAYVAPLAVTTAGYALFQAANNTGAMLHIDAGQRGVVSGMLGLSRNLGLVTGASLMGAVFLMVSTTLGAAAGLQATFGVSLVLVLGALVIARAGRAFVGKTSLAA
jgi:EmrB/QacA subfamily drug resistance transporter